MNPSEQHRRGDDMRAEQPDCEPKSARAAWRFLVR
jgi:hypothetical protein